MYALPPILKLLVLALECQLCVALHASAGREQLTFLGTHRNEKPNGFIAIQLFEAEHERRANVTIGSSLRTKPHASLVQLETTKGSSPSVPRKDFYLPILVGLPPQKFLVTLDNGSGNLVLPSTTCQSTACKMHRTYDQLLSGTAQDVMRIDEPARKVAVGKEVISLCFGRGHATGNVVSDVVCLGSSRNLCAEKTQFVAAFEETEVPFALLAYDGILGVGLPATSITPRFNVMGNLADKKALMNDRFAIWLAHGDDGEPSEVTFGDFNPARLASGVIWEKIHDVSSGYWQISADIMVDNQPLGLGTHPVAIDTGTSVIAGPQSLLDALEESLNVEPDCSNFHQLPLLGFKFRDTILNLEPADYVSRNEDRTKCTFRFASLELPNGIILLGDPFLRKYYTIFDRDTLQVGLALAHHKQNLDKPIAVDQLVIRIN